MDSASQACESCEVLETAVGHRVDPTGVDQGCTGDQPWRDVQRRDLKMQGFELAKAK